MTRTAREISHDVRKLETERRAEIARAMAEYDTTVYQPKRKALIVECGGLGHDWAFDGLGPTGMSWFRCCRCKTMEAREE